MCTDMYWCVLMLLMFTNVNSCIMMYTDVSWCVLMYTNVYWCKQMLLMCTDVYDVYWTDACWFILMCTNVNLSELMCTDVCLCTDNVYVCWCERICNEIYRCVWMSPNMCWCILIMYWRILMSPDVNWCVLIFNNVCGCVQMWTNVY